MPPTYHPDFLIETVHLYISHFRASSDAHCDFLVEILNAPAFTATKLRRTRVSHDRESARELISVKFLEEHQRNGHGKYLVSLKPDPHPLSLAPTTDERLQGCEPVGLVALTKGNEPNSYTVPDIGFVIHPNYTRRGYAKEAAKAVLGMAKLEGVDDVIGICESDNAASKATLRSIGFENQGEMELKGFGDGNRGLVWVRPGMSKDLSRYGF